MEPQDLSVQELKKFRKQQTELKNNAISNLVQTKATIVISMIDKELQSRGYDTEKLFKD